MSEQTFQWAPPNRLPRDHCRIPGFVRGCRRTMRPTPTLDDIRQAHTRIRDHIVRTPLIEAPSLADRLKGKTRVFIKCESMQAGGAFKSRGACNAIFSLSDTAARHGVATHSSGNHAIAVARAAQRRGIPAHIVMPKNASSVKVARVRQFGVEPTFCAPNHEAREAEADRIVRENGATLIHPFDAFETIAGQATVALETLEQQPDLDVLIAPLGGGGLLSGTLLTVRRLKPEITVIGAEPEWADDGYRSWKSGKREPVLRHDTIAEGLRTPVGKLTFPLIREWVDDILTVSEAAIMKATDDYWRELKLVAEPSGAVTLAALLSHPERFAGKTVGLILSGGNMDLEGGSTTGLPSNQIPAK